MTDFLKVLPLAVVMVAGPQIITAIMLATSVRPRANSSGYVGGAMLAAVFNTCLFFFLARALGLAAGGGASHTTVDWVLLVVLLAAAVKTFTGRKQSDPPAWMSKLQGESPGGAFRLGLLLFLLMPTDIMMEFTVGAYLAGHDLALWHSAGFLGLTALLIGSPLLVLLLMGRRADTVLPATRDWMQTNAWVVSEAVIALFVVMQVNSIVTA